MRDAGGRFAFADERFQHGPGETHSDRYRRRAEDLSRRRAELRGDEIADGHDAQTELERGEVAAALAELSAPPRGERINEAEQRGDGEPGLVIEAELVVQQKIDVGEIQDGAEGVEAFDRVAENLVLAAGVHGWREISVMAVRQYHFTASVIGGVSRSSSAAIRPASISS